MNPHTELERPRILLVDDRPDNLLALRAVLEPLDVDVVSAGSGPEALLALLDAEFALVVLDVQMPEMDGFETAQLIKGRERTRLLPIIFLTAISGEPEHHVAGYRSGAVDYVYKPFDPEILRAKVLVFVELWTRGRLIEHQRRSLAEQLATLDKVNAELERSNAVLDSFAARAAEDLLEPLDALSGFLELLGDRHGAALGSEGASLVERAARLADRQRARVGSLLDYTGAATAAVETGAVDLEEAVAEATARLGQTAPTTVSVVPGSLREVCGDHGRVVRVLELLIGRAAAAGAGVVTVDGREDGPWSLLRVADDGCSASDGELATMFTPAQRGATTLDNIVCRRLVERHGGTIWAELREPQGTAVSFTLPSEACW
jgi:two-component system sensor histidine kinase/response regulator